VGDVICSSAFVAHFVTAALLPPLTSPMIEGEESHRCLFFSSFGRRLLDQTSVEFPPGLALSLVGLLPGLHLCLPGSLLLLSRTLHLHNRRSAPEDHHDTEP
jgi:hypothetical protein